MLLNTFLQQIRSSLLMIHHSGHDALTDLANLFLNGGTIQEKRSISISSNFGESYEDSSPSDNPFDKWNEGSIALIPLNGIMLKSGSWFHYGVDDLAYLLNQAYKSPKIAGVLFKGNTPGGSIDSLYLMEETLRNKSKPTWMLVDGTLCSCGMYIGSFCDRIFAMNEMCTLGGVGVFGRLVGPSENSGFKIVEVYPDESYLKNYPEREAMNGNPEPMKEELSKLAIHFQNIIKQNRPGITDKEVFAGKTYFAKDAVAAGLIDAVKSERETVSELIAFIKNVPSQEVREEISLMYK